MREDELPEGWTVLGIDQLCHRVTDGTHFSPKEQNRRGGFKYVTAKNIREWGLDLSDVTYVSEAIHRPIFQRCNPEKDDVLYIKDGATAGIAILNPLQEEFSLLSSVALLKPDRSRLDPSFLKWYLMSPVGRRAMLDQVTGSAITRLTLEIIRGSEVPTPPLPEQKRIVAKVDELLACVNAARERLERVHAVLKRFRQAVLAAACDGRLTEDWRAGRPACDGWQRRTLGSLLREPLRNGHSARASADGRGVRTLTLSAVTYGDFSPKNTKMTIAEPSRVRDLWLQPGDILIERSNTPELVGTSRLYRGPARFAIFPDLVIRARVTEKEALPPFVEIVLQTQAARRFFMDNAQGSAGTMPKIDQGVIERFEFDLPGIAEAAEVVRRVEALFKLADAIEKRVATSTARAEKLTQAILAKAFRGDLVPTEAELARREGRTYETALALLERLSLGREHMDEASKRTLVDEGHPRHANGNRLRKEG